MDQIFSFLWQTRIFVLMCISSASSIVIADLLSSVTLLAVGIGLMALAVVTYVWVDSRQYPEVG